MSSWGNDEQIEWGHLERSTLPLVNTNTFFLLLLNLKYVRNLKTFDEENLEGNADEEPKKKKKEDTEVPKNETKKNDKVKKKCVRDLKTFDEENLEGNADEEPKKKKKGRKMLIKKLYISVFIVMNDTPTH